MGTNIADPFFKDWNIKYPFLNNLPLYLKYNMFYEYYVTETTAPSLCDSYLEQDSPYASNILSLCKKTDSVLQAISSINTNNLDNARTYCKCLSYLLYYELNKFKAKDYEIKELYDSLDDIKKIYNLNNENCNLVNFKIDSKIFSNKKELYFHSEILKFIKIKNNELNHNEKELYKKYLDECTRFYSKIRSDDICKNIEIYGQELKEFVDTFNATIKILIQKELVESMEDLQPPELSLCSPNIAGSKAHGLQDRMLHFPKPMGDDVRNYSFEDHIVDHDSSNRGKTLGIALSTFSGISLLSLLLYKFTNLKSYLPHGKIKNKIFFNEIEDENQELLLQNSEIQNVDLHNPMYCMQYQSIENA
ncbi:PIR Superfamily Protein [Plasmodium ovale wallikeri]|uniref:PIR Superfamily Protein n=1 Tax=Plasmodium ovale wallikeri TaxID=864142 RepID=A0A1A9AJL4_PLAOA|nr:PIR Superfamily Protein [Plasmodium ovale wallikeri]SBT56283.1 PIR Superfamily Protein [Plasmodium ovale wallikeri]